MAHSEHPAISELIVVATHIYYRNRKILVNVWGMHNKQKGKSKARRQITPTTIATRPWELIGNGLRGPFTEVQDYNYLGVVYL